MLQLYWRAIRPKTLVAVIGPVLLANALAYQAPTFDLIIFLLTLACALCLQIAVNLANDVFDAETGVDSENRLGPQRMVQSGLLPASKVKGLAYAMTCFAIIFGLILVYHGGIIFLVLGILAIAGVYSYSAGPYPLASHGLGELAVFIFFGLIAVIGSYYLQTFQVNTSIIVYACSCGLYSAAIMLVNNIRDIETDALANKMTLAVKLGTRLSKKLYQGLLCLALVLHLIATMFLPLNSMTSELLIVLPLLICMPLTLVLSRQISTVQGKALNATLERTAQLGFIYALSNAILLFIG